MSSLKQFVDLDFGGVNSVVGLRAPVLAADAARLIDLPGGNVIINGSMRQAQRGTSFAAAANGTYTLDRWVYAKVGAAVHTITQDTDVPTVAQAGHYIPYSLKLALTTADTAIAAGDYCFFGQRIEGYNFQRIAQRSFTISFWIKATVAGIYSLSAQSGGFDRSYISNFTINAANTWEYKTVTVPASPSAGTWYYTNLIGLSVSIILATGSTFHTTAGAWQTGNFFGTASNINGVDTGATNFWITAFQVEPGSVATEFEMPDILTEVEQCKRYYWKTFPYATAPAQNAGVSGVFEYRATSSGAVQWTTMIPFPVPMRALPGNVTYNPSAANALWRNQTLGADSGTPSISVMEWGFMLRNPQVAGDVAANILRLHAAFDAEL